MSINATAVFAPNQYGVTGLVRFTQEGNTLDIKYNIVGLSDGEHGFHIHEYGDLTDGCESACAHFNPYNKNHGGLDSLIVDDIDEPQSKHNKIIVKIKASSKGLG